MAWGNAHDVRELNSSSHLLGFLNRRFNQLDNGYRATRSSTDLAKKVGCSTLTIHYSVKLVAAATRFLRYRIHRNLGFVCEYSQRVFRDHLPSVTPSVTNIKKKM